LLDDAFVVERLEDIEDYEDKIARAGDWKAWLSEMTIR